MRRNCLRGMQCVLSIAVVVLAATAVAANAQRSGTGQVRVDYVVPDNAAYRPLYDKLRSERWLEQMQTLLQGFRLPRPITLTLKGCGEVDAWYQAGTVGLCYEYLFVVERRARSRELPTWVTREEALAGAFVDAFLHEFGHALFEYHAIPVLGREEDAADQLSAIMMLKLGGDEADSLIRGTATVYLAWIDYFQGRRRSFGDQRLASGAKRRDARQHSSAAQRLYNLVCLAYGAEKRRYAELAKAVELPESRAEDCSDEYAQVSRAYTRLIAPLWDRKRLPASQRAFRFFVERR